MRPDYPAWAASDRFYFTGTRRTSMARPFHQTAEETLVSSIRRGRKQLSQETGTDINRLADHVSQAAANLCDKPGLRCVEH